MGDITGALILYEACVADCFSSQSSYDRLRHIYTRQEWYEDALRVCLAYVALPEQPRMGNREFFVMHAERLAKAIKQQRGEAGRDG